MATITSATSGNWSDVATWVGGVVPTSADDVVIASSHIIDADIDFIIKTLSPGGGSTGFLRITTNRNIICTIINSRVQAGGSLVNINTAGITVNITSDVYGTSFSDVRAISINANCIVNIYGNIINVGATTTNSNEAILIAANAVVNVFGNISCAATTTTGRLCGIRCGATCTLNVTGNLNGNTLSGNNNPIRDEAAGCTINITGNISANNSFAITSNQASTISINGNISAGTVAAINNAGSAVLIINGTVTASNNSVAITSSSTTAINVINGLIFNTNGFNAVYCIKVLLGVNTTSWRFQQYLSTDKTLYTPGVNLGNPVITDVRNGVTYASGSLTGTMKVPPASSVAVGVPVDNTIGTAIISISDMGALLSSYVV